MQNWNLYIIRCKDGSLYAGISIDVKRRFEEQQSGSNKCAKYLRGRGPLKIVWKKKVGDKSSALRMERKVKKLSKIKKEMLVCGKLKFKVLGGGYT
jgi:putative endonuclease